MKKLKRKETRELGHAEKTVIIDWLQEENLLLKEQIKRLNTKLKHLEGKLSKNSRNSSKPPSSDTNQPKKTTSSKKKSDKKPGGQPGHKGHHLKLSQSPDEIVRLEVVTCQHCGCSLRKRRATIERRQQFEIPKPKIQITEYQAESKHCTRCDFTTTACFPNGITHQTQYGPRAKSLMVYLNQYQFLPYERTRECFQMIYGHSLSPGTIVNAVSALAERLTSLDISIKQALAKAKMAHCDETSMSVNGHKHWLHTVGHDQLVHYDLHPNRGQQATRDIGILPEFKGILVHDHWKSYFVYDKPEHALCNAHHLRELRFIHEQHQMKWAKSMSDLLMAIHEHKESIITGGRQGFSKKQLADYQQQYERILKQSRKEQALRGTRDSHNLIKRLTQHRQDVLRFMLDFNVPFTNNLSERDLRMCKVKQKISGCFKQLSTGKQFCKIRNLIVSAKKNQHNVFDIIQLAFHKIISVDDLVPT